MRVEGAIVMKEPRGSEEGCKSLIRPILPISLFVPVNHEESDTLAGGGLGSSELDRGRERWLALFFHRFFFPSRKGDVARFPDLMGAISSELDLKDDNFTKVVFNVILFLTGKPKRLEKASQQRWGIEQNNFYPSLIFLSCTFAFRRPI